MDRIKNEYLKLSKKNINYMSMGIVLSSLVFVIPFIIIIINGWWEPLGSFKEGIRWVIVSSILLSLVYASLIFDRIYRKH